MLEKVEVIDRMEILEDGQIQVRKATRILEDGIMISQSFHRHIVEPGQDMTKEHARVQEVATAIHSKKIIDDYVAKKAKSESIIPTEAIV
jgi:hypothetical protein